MLDKAKHKIYQIGNPEICIHIETKIMILREFSILGGGHSVCECACACACECACVRACLRVCVRA